MALIFADQIELQRRLITAADELRRLLGLQATGSWTGYEDALDLLLRYVQMIETSDTAHATPFHSSPNPG